MINFTTHYFVDPSLPLSANELIDQFFFGIPLCTRDGRVLGLDVIEKKIKSSTVALENFLGIKINRTFMTERVDFIRSDFIQWGYMQCNYPVQKIVSLKGFLSKVQQIEYPKDWLSFKQSSEERLHDRNVFIVPAGDSGNQTNSVVFSGITPHLGFFGFSEIPNYWDIQYCTGFIKPPEDIKEAIGKLASMQIFAILGDILLGAGIASSSLSLDGLSQSIATTQSAENSAYSARVRQYQAELKKELPQLKDAYSGFTFMVI